MKKPKNYKYKQCTLVADIQIIGVQYSCPWCFELIAYPTDGLPPMNQCHKCLKPLRFKILWIPNI